MSLFCALWVPLFYLFRRAFTGGNSSGGVWALLLGGVTAVFQFFIGGVVSPGGFGFSRWLYGFVEIVSLVALFPFFVCLLIYLLKGFSGNIDFTDFALLYLIPVGALRALTWSSSGGPILLVAVPLLWTALAVGVSFFVNWTVNNPRWYVIVLSVIGVSLLPALAALSYWAFFSQKTPLGFFLFFLTQIPFCFSLVFSVTRH